MRIKFTLRHGIPLLLFLFLCVSAAIHLWYMLGIGREITEKEAWEEATLQGTHLANMLEHMLQQYENRGIEKELSWAATDPTLVNLFFIDDTETVMYAMDRKFVGKNFRQAVDAEASVIITETIRKAREVHRMDSRRKIIFSAFPVNLSSKSGELLSSRIGILFLKHDYSHIMQLKLARSFKEFYRLTAFMAVLCVALWILLRITLMRRVEQLVDATRHLARGDLSARVEIRGDDELAHMGKAFNEMADRIEKNTAHLKQMEDRLDVAVSGADLGIWDLNVKDGTLFVNHHLAQLLGYGPEELEISLAALEGLVHPDDKQNLLTELNRCSEEIDRSWRIECRMKTKTGKWRWYAVRGRTIVYDEDLRPLRVSGTINDIAERKVWEKVRENLVSDLRKSLENVRTLKGLVPVCAWCHKVRDDEGYWKKLETYLHDHTEADISHGICPDCATKQRQAHPTEPDPGSGI